MSSTSETPICEARNISVAYSPTAVTPAIQDVSLSIHSGEIVAILGPSGCGKSTLLRSLIGLVKPTAGQVFADGEPLEGIHPRVSLVFQNFALYPWLTVKQNIAVALEGRGFTEEQAREKIAKCIEVIGLDGFEDSYPKELSGGMKQRVGFARALARDPAILCLDEPFSALDIFTAESLRREVYRLVTRVGGKTDETCAASGVQTVLLITHNIEEAVFLADRVVILGRNPGHIKQIVPVTLPHPRDYAAPAFQATVQRLRDVFVSDYLPDQPVEASVPAHIAATPAAASSKLEPLPHVNLGEVLGLLEIVSRNGGEMEVFDLDEVTEYDFGRTLNVVKAGEMLDFLDTPKNKVLITDAGKKILGASLDDRKLMILARLRTIGTFRFVIRLIGESKEGDISKEDLVAELTQKLPYQNAEQLFETVANWGRFAELFEYDPVTDMLSLS